MVFEFGAYRLDPQRHELQGPEGTVALEPKAMALLTLLVTQRDRAVSKQDIFDAIWPGITVTDASLSTTIRQIRKALGDDGTRQRMIRTIHGHGYRFMADVAERAPASAATDPGIAPPAPATKAHHRHPALSARWQ